jgi:hypothetical protein
MNLRLVRRLGPTATALMAGACLGNSQLVIPENVTPSATTSACMEAFASAARIDKNADSVSDLYPVIRACTNLQEWQGAFDASGGAGFSATAAQVLKNACLAPEVKDESLCAQVD